MISKHLQSTRLKQRNGLRRKVGPVESLSARVLRLRIARGYSPYDLAAAAGVYIGTIQRLESGKPVDKRVLADLAGPLDVSLCRLVCGEHDCDERACLQPNGPRTKVLEG